MIKTLLFAVLMIQTGLAFAQTQSLGKPLGIPLQLSGSFCELRSNHFHAGLDFRTQGVEGHPLKAVRDGYVARITVSPWGYGNAVYINHPSDSITTVYGHIQRFNDIITDIVKKRQYEMESFSVDVRLDSNALPVKQGDIFAYSGNTGSSGGPHLHFEIRDSRTGDYLDPLPFYRNLIYDSRKPELQGLIIYPMNDTSMVNGSSSPLMIGKTSQITASAWGEISFGIRAVDRMNGTNFSFGIKQLSVKVDSLDVFLYHSDRFSYDESDMLNSCIDYPLWIDKRQFYFKTFIEPGNTLRSVLSRNCGKIRIDKEREYKILIQITDLYGNTNVLPIIINGIQEVADISKSHTAKVLRWYEENVFEAEGIRLTLPFNSLYTNVTTDYDTVAGITGVSGVSRVSGEELVSKIHLITKKPVPLHISGQLTIKADILPDSLASFAGIIRINLYNNKASWIGGKYHNDSITANISELGAYAIAVDTVKPKITPVEPSLWQSRKQITVKIKDDFSGISSFRGEIDGKYVLFEYDPKNAKLYYVFDNKRLMPGYHRLMLTVTDNAGNTAEFRHTFLY